MPHRVSKLFQPTRVGNITLKHRITLAPLTRFRANEAHVPTDIMVDYYAQRASVPGTLLITEATFVAPRGGGMAQVPGIWSKEQIAGWKKVTDAVHARGSFIYMQIWAVGRAADPEILAQSDSPANPGGPYPYVSASDVQMSTKEVPPRALSHEEILEYIELFGKAAHNAVFGAGFDGVEIHGAHGYLVDQFIQDNTNKRTDAWGGSVEKRSRFALEVVKSVTRAIGEERTAIRFSPWSTYQDMRMEDPVPTFTYLVSQIREAYPQFSYIHVAEPRVAGTSDRTALEHESNDFLRKIWNSPQSVLNGSLFMSAGAYTPESATKAADEKGDLVAFGRHFISNPDLPARIKKNIPFTPYNRSTFYSVGSPVGYNDQGFADAEAEANYSRGKNLSTVISDTVQANL